MIMSDLGSFPIMVFSLLISNWYCRAILSLIFNCWVYNNFCVLVSDFPCSIDSITDKPNNRFSVILIGPVLLVSTSCCFSLIIWLVILLIRDWMSILLYFFSISSFLAFFFFWMLMSSSEYISDDMSG